jgi:hypothetical protein
VGLAGDGCWSVRVECPGRAPVEVSGLPYSGGEAFKAVEWLGFCSTSTRKAAFYLDDFAFGEIEK